MQVIYKEGVLNKIYSVVNDAKLSGKKIDKILLSAIEMDELCKDLGGPSGNGTFDYRVVPFKDFLVVESM